MVNNRDGPTLFAAGTRIGRYRIEQEIGRGGSSVVYLATDLNLGKRWAIKVIPGQEPATDAGKEDGTGKGRRISLSEEAELMKRLDHPALPGIIDILEKEGFLILVMDYVEGENLEMLLKRAGPFREETVREWMYRLAEVLAYLHEQDPPVIYRDMKPANVIRKQDGSLILLDLGIAREYKRGGGQDTEVLGTRGYAPPEQYGNAQTDIRSDIYSLGMTAAVLLTGCPPEEDPYLYKTHPFRKICPEISKQFESILNRCLAFSPQDRYGSCRELMQDLRGKPVHKKKAVNRKNAAGRKKAANNKKTANKKKTANRKKAANRKNPDGRRKTVSGKKKKAVIIVLAVLAGLGSMAAVLRRETERPAVLAETTPEQEQELEQDSLQKIQDLLDASGTEGTLSEEDSAILQQLLAELPPEARRNKTAYAELCFAAGRAYLYTYAGDNGSFRGRILRARPFFDEALEYLAEAAPAEACPEEERKLSAEKVQAYVRLCDFFSLYMFDREGISEPEAEECERVLEAIAICLEETEQQENGDGAWLQLTLLQSMEALLGEYRQNFAAAGIPRDSVLQILQSVEEKTGGVPVKRETLLKLKEEVLSDCRECRDQIICTYESIEKWKEAEDIYGNTAG